MVYHDVDTAAASVEAIDVEEGAIRAYDSTAQLLTLTPMAHNTVAIGVSDPPIQSEEGAAKRRRLSSSARWGANPPGHAGGRVASSTR
jgi:hypothetical protein